MPLLPKRLGLALSFGLLLLLCLSLLSGQAISSFSVYVHRLSVPKNDLENSTPLANISGHRLDDSRQLGFFSDVFVVSRTARVDRRATIEKLFAALDIRWSYIDAVSYDDPLVDKIAKCVRWQRKHTLLRTFQWIRLSEFEDLIHSSFPFQPELSTLTDLAMSKCTLQSSSQSLVTSSLSPISPLGEPTAALENHIHSRNPSFRTPLTCAVQDRTHGVRFQSTLPPYMLLTPPKLACWYSHLLAIQQVAAWGEPLEPGIDDSGGPALILEDDVDIEQDIRTRLQEIWEFLPNDWDILFLGHCWSDESRHAALRDPRPSGSPRLYPNMTVYPSFAPKCTHAYALSRAGARRLLLHLLHPAFAYSRALDQAFAWLVRSRRLKAYSVVPSVIIQQRMSQSDIDGGEDGLGSGWKDTLDRGSFDSALY